MSLQKFDVYSETILFDTVYEYLDARGDENSFFLFIFVGCSRGTKLYQQSHTRYSGKTENSSPPVGTKQNMPQESPGIPNELPRKTRGEFRLR